MVAGVRRALPTDGSLRVIAIRPLVGDSLAAQRPSPEAHSRGAEASQVVQLLPTRGDASRRFTNRLLTCFASRLGWRSSISPFSAPRCQLTLGRLRPMLYPCPPAPALRRGWLVSQLRFWQACLAACGEPFGLDRSTRFSCLQCRGANIRMRRCMPHQIHSDIYLLRPSRCGGFPGS